MTENDLVASLVQSASDLPPGSHVPTSLSVVDRQQLILLHRILARLVDDDTSDPRLGKDGDSDNQLHMAEVLAEGWALEYETEFIDVDQELREEDCAFVRDLFSMFQDLEHSIEALDEDERLSAEEKRGLTFQGFDLNDPEEVRLLTYGRWLIEPPQNRWPGLREAFSHANDDGNSHHPTLDWYRCLLGAYRQIEPSHRALRPLSVAQLKNLARFRVRPDNR